MFVSGPKITTGIVEIHFYTLLFKVSKSQECSHHKLAFVLISDLAVLLSLLGNRDVNQIIFTRTH